MFLANIFVIGVNTNKHMNNKNYPEPLRIQWP